MPLPAELRLRDAGPDDLPAIARLREEVGWTAHDWALRAAIEPPRARCVVAVDRGERIVAVGSGIAYGAIGHVGNMVVAEDERRRGLGGAVLEAVIGFLTDRGCTRLELFATPSGRPLYARYGFVLGAPSAMASVERSRVADGASGAVVEETSDADALAAYDAPRFGGDRHPLLAMMARDPDRPLLIARVRDEIGGYLWLRPDGPRVGPFVADDPGIAAALLAEAFRRAPEADALTLNIAMANEPGTRWLRSIGVALEPWDGRMARGDEVARREETIYSNVVGALG